MFGIGTPEAAVILVLALLVFGPRKLPELGKSLGAGLREFKRSTQGLKDEFEDSIRESGGSEPDKSILPKPISAREVLPDIAQE